MIYYHGRCKPQDYVAARMWFTRAATYESKTAWERGSDFALGPAGFFNTQASSFNASLGLTEIYSQGLGVQKDLTEAWFWINYALNKIIENDSLRNNAERARRDTEARMTPEQLASARSRVSTWKPTAQ